MIIAGCVSCFESNVLFVDCLFQTVSEDAVKFVVDRRPNKTLSADVHLWTVSETAATNSSAETVHRDDDGDGGGGKQHKRSKKRQHLGDIQDRSVEFSADEMKISSPLTSSLEGSKPGLTHTGSDRVRDVSAAGPLTDTATSVSVRYI